MIILMEDKLAHVDSYTDVLEHYGVKGMKWRKNGRGVEGLTEEEKQLRMQGRLANLDSEYDKYAQAMGNSLRRQIAESKTRTVDRGYSKYASAMGNNPKRLSRAQYYNKNMASLNRQIRANGGKPVKYRARTVDFAN